MEDEGIAVLSILLLLCGSAATRERYAKVGSLCMTLRFIEEKAYCWPCVLFYV